MKKILITLVLALIGVAASGQVVYSTDYKSEAGWRNNSKKHLMF